MNTLSELLDLNPNGLPFVTKRFLASHLVTSRVITLLSTLSNKPRKARLKAKKKVVWCILVRV